MSNNSGIWMHQNDETLVYEKAPQLPPQPNYIDLSTIKFSLFPLSDEAKSRSIEQRKKLALKILSFNF